MCRQYPESLGIPPLMSCLNVVELTNMALSPKLAAFFTKMNFRHFQPTSNPILYTLSKKMLKVLNWAWTFF